MMRFFIAFLLLSVLISCKEEPSVILATVTTDEITIVTSNSAIGGGEVLDAGDSEITAIGLVAGEEPTPTLKTGVVSKISDLNLGLFSTELTGLRSNTKYYVRAYVTNGAGTAYGEDMQIRTDIVIPTALEFNELTEIKGYSFTQAIGFQGSDNLQALFIANRQINHPDLNQHERVFRYDLLFNTTSEIYDAELDYISKEIQIINDQINVVGGQYLRIYQPDLNAQPQVVLHEQIFSRHGSAQMAGDIYAYGGDLNSVDSDKIWKWDVANERFVQIAIMPTAKSYAGGEIINDKLYVFGGQKEFQGTLHDDIIYIYSFSEDSFETLHLPEALYQSFTAQVGELIYVAGHYNPSFNDITDIFFGVFNTLDNSFTEINIDLSDVQGASIWALTAVGNDLYVIYGDPLNDIDELSLEQTFTIQKAEIP